MRSRQTYAVSGDWMKSENLGGSQPSPCRASGSQIRNLFLAEAALLSALGAAFGSLLGQAGIALLQWLYPNFPMTLPVWAWASALLVALSTGLLFGVMPARKAAQLDPVAALSRR